MSSIIIKVENISKQYRLGNVGLGTVGADLNRWYQTSLLGKEDPYLKIGEENDRSITGNSEYVWALRNINFEVKQGEVLGIIGRNGAGKSTLLKILSRTTSPTTGSIKIKGRVASLLEVGTGFHPELTGRENIFLNGAILGMTKHDIKKRFDEIVDFAGVERYIDTPVKRYSSGMYVRLAFGVAAHLDPEILIVDEVLAVGDAEFQKKALGKMKNVSSNDGRTVLFVSHNMNAIRQLCEKAILLNNGSVESEGQISDIIKLYFQKERALDNLLPLDSYRRKYIKDVPVLIEAIYIKEGEERVTEIGINADFIIVIKINVFEKISNAIIAFSIMNAENVNVGIAFAWDDDFYLNVEEPGVYDVHCHILSCQLTPGSYSIQVGLNQSEKTGSWDMISFYPLFKIENKNNVIHFRDRSWGINHFNGNKWELRKAGKNLADNQIEASQQL